MSGSIEQPDFDFAAMLSEAMALHQQGRVKEARACYDSLLGRDPANISARYHQGLLYLQTGEMGNGMAALERVIELDPGHAEAHYNLGLAYSQRGCQKDALFHFERAAALLPDRPEPQFYLGLTHAGLGQHESARHFLEQAVALSPGLAEAHHNLASVLSEMGLYNQAIASFQQAIALNPTLAEAYNGLGAALYRLNRHEEAGRQFQQAIRLKPDLAEAYTGLSDVMRMLGRYQDAANCCEQAIRIRPDDALAYVVLGQALAKIQKHKAALASFERALVLQPDCAAAHNELGAALHAWGRHGDARMHGERAMDLDSRNDVMMSWQLFNLHYVPGISATELAFRHRQFGERFGLPKHSGSVQHDNVRDPEKTLRVGFVSGDFRHHSVGHFMADLLASLKETQLALYAYANQKQGDVLTEQIKPMFDVWQEVYYLDDDAMAAKIRSDGIDILVDLSGHTEGNRLKVFARKPAPVQVTYLGYPNTTGLSSIDYILGDRRMFPPNERELYTETPWCLPDTSLCFRPPSIPVHVNLLPAAQNGFVTFGCLNKREKINDEVISVWSRILKAVPSSRLLLQNDKYSDDDIKAYMRHCFIERGVDGGRVEFIGKISWRDHLETYNRVDIALDPFPYNGTTTSVEGLWMGVPFLTLKGDRLSAHMGESILHAVGMPEWIAEDQDEYVSKAVAFSALVPDIVKLRGSLRERLLKSPICEGSRFARNMETAFREMWREWCSC